MPVTTLDERTALVVVDLQNGVLARPGAPLPAAEVIGRTDMSGHARGPLPEGWDTIVDDLTGHAEDIVVTKRNWGSFHGTDRGADAHDHSVQRIFPLLGETGTTREIIELLN